MIKFFLTLILLPFFLFSGQTQVISAQESDQTTIQENFTTAIDTTYTVDQSGQTFVSHRIRITNKTPTLYLKQYALKTNNIDLEKPIVKIGPTAIPANIVTTQEGTSIGITFPDEVVGQGKVRDFTIEYTNPSIAVIAGRVLEIHIPRFGDDQSFTTNTATVLTPIYFSKPVRVTPQPNSIDFVQTQAKMVFTRTNGESISAIFGQEQNYKLSLRYHLENTTSAAAITQISLPPDTTFQKVFYHSLDPLPQEMKQDSDGNWIATYKIGAASVMTVQLAADVQVNLEPDFSIPVTQPLSEHITAEKFWEVNHSSIQEKAQKYQTPESIYTHVVESLSYSHVQPDLDNLKRFGAVDAFTQPDQAVCQEFSDAFIAVARAAKIPARRLVGYAYTQNATLRPLSFAGDVLHAWPEYYNYETATWTPVDPTWGNTTGGIDYFNQFDLNHIVFAINGTSSTLPNPAGAYKADDKETKDVEVTIGEQFPSTDPNISTQIEQKKLFFIPIPGMYSLKVTNETGRAWYNITIAVENSDATVETHIADEGHISALLPLQTQTFDISFFTKKISMPKESITTLHYQWANTGQNSNEQYQTTVTSAPEIIIYLQRPETYIYLAIGVICITLTTGSILVFRQKRARYIRR